MPSSCGRGSSDLYHGQGDKFQWIVRCDEQPAGWLTLVITNWDHGLAEIGYALSTPFQKRGIMVQALHLLLADLFLNSPLERIEARCDTRNHASQRVLREGRLPPGGLSQRVLRP